MVYPQLESSWALKPCSMILGCVRLVPRITLSAKEMPNIIDLLHSIVLGPRTTKLSSQIVVSSGVGPCYRLASYLLPFLHEILLGPVNLCLILWLGALPHSMRFIAKIPTDEGVLVPSASRNMPSFIKAEFVVP